MDKLKVFYDGSCHLCYNEVNFYKKKDSKCLIEIVDIKSNSFIASDYNLNETEVNKHMHAVDESGNIFRGVASFIEIWKRLPGIQYKYMTKIAQINFLRPTLNICYNIFAGYIRPYLPKRRCDKHCKIN